MFIIEDRLLDKSEDQVKCLLNYPVIKLINNENGFVEYINRKIYEDVLCFKDVVEQILKEEDINSVVNLMTEYTISFNKNNIISIPIEFSQFIELYNINYINSYNYDFNEEKEIKLRDIFDELIDYKTFIGNMVKIQLAMMLDNNEEIGINNYDLINMIYNIEIYEDQAFYLEEDGLVICLSSYEMGSNIRKILEFKIMYEDAKYYFSDYFLRGVISESTTTL
ncbi:DUF3298 and DUF4163 domain-containing protein [Romboutsia sp. 1001713B170207_170306_H8]|uniref:DUF3298 and DUF4163 domain-containing protein n=1 Tax=Romboutsia sp. 1001713B170207_170306_H8 TaxID=2787112 RepID=UPI000822AFAE|nr:DUF3298 and DUF4163 domain-containing protein [Romboutsia sp. 1001713B170207_170306_H8]SCH18958.1 Protein of uncharacterised function (DUF3298) [uncultured Clostridium sp.]